MNNEISQFWVNLSFKSGPLIFRNTKLFVPLCLHFVCLKKMHYLHRLLFSSCDSSVVCVSKSCVIM